MAIVKRIVCLANSRKPGGRCVAGRELIGGRLAGWLRPVGFSEYDAISKYERQYRDASDPEVLDVIELQLRGPRPKTYQQENWLLEPGKTWLKKGRVNWNALQQMNEPGRPLWVNGYSTYSGTAYC